MYTSDNISTVIGSFLELDDVYHSSRLRSGKKECICVCVMLHACVSHIYVDIL